MKKIFLFVLVLSIAGISMSCNKVRSVIHEATKPASEKELIKEKAPEKKQVSEKQQASEKQQEPKKPEFHVIDTNSKRGDLEDNVRLYNKTSRSNISFTVYLKDPRDDKWKVYGTGDLKGPGDTEFIRSKLSGDLDDYRYFAIQAKDTRDYRYDFEKSHNDLYIYIYDK
jgi:hypothetical protein